MYVVPPLKEKLATIRQWNNNKTRLAISEDSGISLFKVWEFERGEYETLHSPPSVIERLAYTYGLQPSFLAVLMDDEANERLCNPNRWELLPDQAKRIIEARNFVVLDTETTGRDNRLSQVCEIAIVGPDGQELLNSYVQPEGSIPAEAMAIHHITDDMVKDAPTFPEIFPKIVECVKDRLVLVYNADYDITLLQSLAMHYSLDLPEFEPLCLMILYANHWRLQSKGLTNKWQSLSNACFQQDVVLEDAHRAMSDTMATYRLLVKLAEQAEREEVEA